jgi:hypothetical protein
MVYIFLETPPMIMGGGVAYISGKGLMARGLEYANLVVMNRKKHTTL